MSTSFSGCCFAAVLLIIMCHVRRAFAPSPLLIDRDQARQIALGRPFEYQGRTYRLRWDANYAGVYIHPILDKTGRSKSAACIAARAVLHRLPLDRLREGITMHVRPEFREVFDNDRGPLRMHLLTGGVLRVEMPVQGRDTGAPVQLADPLDAKETTRHFSVALEGKGRLTRITVSRWPRLRAFFDFWRRITVRRREYRQDRLRMMELSILLGLANARDVRQSSVALSNQIRRQPALELDVRG